jgi:hypothetical protein
VALDRDDILASARITLQDVAGARWLSPELDGYLLDAERIVAHLLPNMGPVVAADISLQTGLEQEILTSGGREVSRVLDIRWNLSSGSPSSTIARISKNALDDQRPAWIADAAADEIIYWIPDEDTPRNFMVYPKIKTGTFVRAQLALIPDTAAHVSEFKEVCKPAFVDYLIARAWSKDATYAKAMLDHMGAFEAHLKVLGAGNSIAFTKLQNRGVAK